MIQTVIATEPEVLSLSGRWTGFANQGTPDTRHRIDLLFQMRENQLSGVGDDDTGVFVISGEFDHAAQEFRWVQTYLFGDTLFCRGFSDASAIWGTWQNSRDGHGGFKIWPLHQPDATPVPTSVRVAI